MRAGVIHQPFCMGLKLTSYATSETKHHLAWASKVLSIDFNGIVKFLSFAPGYSISKMIGMLMSIAGSVISKKPRNVMKGLWGAEFCEDGYFAWTAGSKVMAVVVSQDTRPHREQEKAPERLSRFKIPCLVTWVFHSRTDS